MKVMEMPLIPRLTIDGINEAIMLKGKARGGKGGGRRDDEARSGGGSDGAERWWAKR